MGHNASNLNVTAIQKFTLKCVINSLGMKINL